MVTTIALLEMAGYVVLLLWGMHMVQSGIVRAFGTNLQRIVDRTLGNRFAAVGAGIAITALLRWVSFCPVQSMRPSTTVANRH